MKDIIIDRIIIFGLIGLGIALVFGGVAVWAGVAQACIVLGVSFIGLALLITVIIS